MEIKLVQKRFFLNDGIKRNNFLALMKKISQEWIFL